MELCGFKTASYLCACLAVLYFQSAVCDSICPSVAVFDSPYDITGDIEEQDYTGIVWVRPAAIWPGQYVVTCNPLNQCSSTAGYGAVANPSTSTLTIQSVSLIDVGTWSIIGTDVNVTNITTVCSLTAAKVPGCHISADRDTDDLEEGVDLSMNVTITGYYCTRQHSFNLTTGNVTERQLAVDSGTSIEDFSFKTELNVTESHFGPVRLNYMCEETQWDLTCTGVNELKKRLTTTLPPTTETTEPFTSETSPSVDSSPSLDTSPSQDTSPSLDTSPVSPAITEHPTSETSPSMDTSSSFATSLASPATTDSPSSSTGNPGTTVFTGGTPVLSGEDPNYALIGGIIGGVLLFIIIVAIILYKCRHMIIGKYRKYIVTKSKGTPRNNFDDTELQRSCDNVNGERNETNHYT